MVVFLLPFFDPLPVAGKPSDRTESRKWKATSRKDIREKCQVVLVSVWKGVWRIRHIFNSVAESL